MFVDCVFSRNEANGFDGFAGAANLTNRTFDFLNCVFYRNEPSGTYHNVADATYTNCTFARNGQLAFSMDPNSNLTVQGCIVDGGFTYRPDSSTLAYNIGVDTRVGIGNLDLDPMFVNRARGNLRLLPGSPAIDHANNDAIAGRTEVDVLGQPRFVDDPGLRDRGLGSAPIADCGAVEFQGDSTGVLTVWGVLPGIVGHTNGLVAVGATPGSSVYFVGGLRDGTTSVPGCPDLSVEIGAAQLIGVQVADEYGEAVQTFFADLALQTRTVRFQAVEHSACRVSNVGTYLFPRQL